GSSQAAPRGVGGRDGRRDRRAAGRSGSRRRASCTRALLRHGAATAASRSAVHIRGAVAEATGAESRRTAGNRQLADVPAGPGRFGAGPCVPAREAGGRENSDHSSRVQGAPESTSAGQHQTARPRSPQRVRSRERHDQAPRTGRGAHVRWRDEGPSRVRGVRRRQRGVGRARGRDRRAAGVPPSLGRAHSARPTAQYARHEAHEPELRRSGARRGGRPRAREGAGVARPAAGIGRQAQVAGLLVVAALGAGGAACARQGEPPGGPPHTTPPQIVRVMPESGAVVPGWKGDAVIEFDEVIDEMPGSRGGGGGGGGGAAPVTGLARQIVLSPVAGDVRVSWHRSAIHVKPAEGWKPNRVYHLELLSGIVDLRRNVMKKGTTVIFSTGAPLPHAALAGTAVQWVEQRALVGAVIRAAPLPDTVAYVTLADSAGDFHLSDIPPGRYLVWAIQDQNNNRQLDRREPFDSITIAVDSSAGAVLWVFAHDTVGPHIRSVDPVDSIAFRIQSTTPRVDTARVRQLLKQRPVPSDRIVVQTAQPLEPGKKYLIRVRDATNLNGAVAAEAHGVLTVPVPKPAPRDTTRAPRDSTKPP